MLKFFKYDLDGSGSNGSVNLHIPWDNASLARLLANPKMVTWLRDHGRNVSSEGIEKFGDEADEADDIGQESNLLKEGEIV